MSGSSLDGVDICHAQFASAEEWSYTIKKVHTLRIPTTIKERLKRSGELSGFDLAILNIQYGEWIGKELNDFISNDSDIDVIGFHGHTTFHKPQSKLSLQLGSGSIISTLVGIPVVDDFRTKDLIHGGQGAPLVPKGELMLFPDFDAWINLGGIANITAKRGQQVIAYDIAPCNQVLNYFAQKIGKEYDENGELAKKGTISKDWISWLQGLDYIRAQPPKSLSNQWGADNILSASKINPHDALQSYVTFLAEEILNSLNSHLSKSAKVLFTGGGTHNHYLLENIKNTLSHNQFEMVIPTKEIIDFKEALIFGFLGLLKKLNLSNTIGETTGADKDTVSGTLHEP